MAHQRPVDRRPSRHRIDAIALELPDDPRRPPRRMRPPQPDDPGLRRRAHLMRARHRAAGPVHQPRQAAVIDIPAQPVVHRLPRHPIPARYIGHARAVIEDFQHRPVPLLGHTQLHQHTRPPCLRPLIDRRQAPKQRKSPQAARSVVKVPELLSPTYRNRVRKLSPGNRNSGVQHLPGSHRPVRADPANESPTDDQEGLTASWRSGL